MRCSTGLVPVIIVVQTSTELNLVNVRSSKVNLIKSGNVRESRYRTVAPKAYKLLLEQLM